MKMNISTIHFIFKKLKMLKGIRKTDYLKFHSDRHKVINIADNDVGDMATDSITSEIKPILDLAEKSLRV